MSEIPHLLPVPSFQHELTIKATSTGIVLLKDGRYKKRYTGSKYSTIDINGKFYRSSADLRKIQAAELLEKNGGKVRHKKKPAEIPVTADLKECLEDTEDNENLLSTKKKNVCGYRVNKMEVRQRILSYINTMKGSKELYFWTVTFPEKLSDEKCYQAFNTWLTALRQKKMLKEYIWIAERQQNKTIHFHIAIPHKMHVKTANKLMQTTLHTFAKNKQINYSTFQAKRYNGVHITKNRKTGRVTNFAIKKGSRALANYLTKYVTKNNESFSHLAWHNSRGYSALFTGLTFTVKEFVAMGFKELIVHRSHINNDFFAFYPWAKDPPEQITNHLFQVNSFVQSFSDRAN